MTFCNESLSLGEKGSEWAIWHMKCTADSKAARNVMEETDGDQSHSVGASKGARRSISASTLLQYHGVP